MSTFNTIIDCQAVYPEQTPSPLPVTLAFDTDNATEITISYSHDDHHVVISLERKYLLDLLIEHPGSNEGYYQPTTVTLEPHRLLEITLPLTARPMTALRLPVLHLQRFLILTIQSLKNTPTTQSRFSGNLSWREISTILPTNDI